jgi:hypothetical protein
MRFWKARRPAAAEGFASFHDGGVVFGNPGQQPINYYS